MYLSKIQITQFKNINHKNLEFSPRTNCFVGENGVGKTNLLDAIYYLSNTKSYFSHQDQQNIQHGSDFFMLEGSFEVAGKQDVIYCGLKQGQKKIIKKNHKIYTRRVEHLGQYPLVIISPYDQDLINAGSEGRRKFMDYAIGLSDRTYLQQLITYNKALAQRNALLKYFAQNKTFDDLSLTLYNNVLIEQGTAIYAKRKEFLNHFLPLFNIHHQNISQNKETTTILYHSSLHHQSFETLLQENLTKDRILQYSSVGIHKDDLIFNIETFPIKKFGSQGQQKSFLIALKLAQFDLLKQYLNIKPLLLLDDIFDKLDEKRVAQLIHMVNEDHFGQIFITDTHQERIKKIVLQLKGAHNIIEIKHERI